MKCVYCREREGEVPVMDRETLTEFFICNGCAWLVGIVEIGYDKRIVDMENAEMENPIKY